MKPKQIWDSHSSSFHQSCAAEGEYIEAEGLRFEVIDMDRQRIDKVLITPLAAKAASTRHSQAPSAQ